MEIDFSGLWSWTLPLWALFVLVLFLVGVMNTPIVIEAIVPSVVQQVGGKRVRFAEP